MDTVMGWRDQHILQPAQLADLFRMHQYAPYLREGVYEGNIDGLKAAKCQGNEVDEAIEWLHDRRAKPNR